MGLVGKQIGDGQVDVGLVGKQKFNLSTRGLNSLTYPVYLKINLLSLLFLLILKIRNPLSFVINIINLFVVLFLTITN